MITPNRWILLPVEFKGIWYNTDYGGFHIYLKDRFKLKLAPDRLREELRKDGIIDLVIDKADHSSATPRWLTREEFEKQFGKIEAIIVDEEVWNSNRYDGYYDSYYFFTADKVIAMREYDGMEYFIAVPRDWKKMIASNIEVDVR